MPTTKRTPNTAPLLMPIISPTDRDLLSFEFDGVTVGNDNDVVLDVADGRTDGRTDDVVAIESGTPNYEVSTYCHKSLWKLEDLP